MQGRGRLQFAQRGLPLILLVVGGTYGISVAVQGKLDLKVWHGLTNLYALTTSFNILKYQA